MKRTRRYLGMLMVGAVWCLTVCLTGGCFSGHLTTDNQVGVKPIHITIDVNVKVQKELADVFGDLDAKQAALADKAKNKE